MVTSMIIAKLIIDSNIMKSKDGLTAYWFRIAIRIVGVACTILTMSLAETRIKGIPPIFEHGGRSQYDY